MSDLGPAEAHLLRAGYKRVARSPASSGMMSTTRVVSVETKVADSYEPRATLRVSATLFDVARNHQIVAQ
jgi:hypothetical protein